MCANAEGGRGGGRRKSRRDPAVLGPCPLLSCSSLSSSCSPSILTRFSMAACSRNFCAASSSFRSADRGERRGLVSGRANARWLNVFTRRSHTSTRPRGGCPALMIHLRLRKFNSRPGESHRWYREAHRPYNMRASHLHCASRLTLADTFPETRMKFYVQTAEPLKLRQLRLKQRSRGQLTTRALACARSDSKAALPRRTRRESGRQFEWPELAKKLTANPGMGRVAASDRGHTAGITAYVGPNPSDGDMTTSSGFPSTG